MAICNNETEEQKTAEDNACAFINPWDSTEYKNNFGCRGNEHPLDAIHEMMTIIDFCKTGQFKLSIHGYKDSKKSLDDIPMTASCTLLLSGA